ncbi:hypothetical protein JZ751_013099 [Albula glossodonta]|uniref:Uncharacterized protein n=1 Tax=Albula glossodonta TaxID=121402 RepID=A0A8T2NX80_9TELE|nr:hypothetical protein JZ751_013099 [Albula glossodonta]
MGVCRRQGEPHPTPAEMDGRLARCQELRALMHEYGNAQLPSRPSVTPKRPRVPARQTPHRTGL